jgi:hypothetical protein
VIERNRLIDAIDRAFDSHVERVFSTFVLGHDDTHAAAHLRSGLQAAMRGYEQALDVATQLTPNG